MQQMIAEMIASIYTKISFFSILF